MYLHHEFRFFVQLQVSDEKMLFLTEMRHRDKMGTDRISQRVTLRLRGKLAK